MSVALECGAPALKMRRIKLVAVASMYLLLCTFGHAHSSANAESPNSALVGLWGTEESLGPLVRGGLTIDTRLPQWRAAIAGFNVPVQHNRDAITLFLPSGLGEFRGRLNKRRNSVDGDWIQPPGLVNNNRYATPVHLTLLSPGVWKGEVIPLDEGISFYVSIQLKLDGSMTAVIVNPEYNMFRRRTYNVVLNAAQITFTNPKRPDDHLPGTYDNTTDHLFLSLLDSYPPLLLSRRGRNEALGFYARSPENSRYVYRKPIAGHDGWRTATLADVGIAEQPVAALLERILMADPTDNPVDIDSLLIAQHGKLVLEEYFHGYDEERPHDMRSASKTFAPVLVGITRQLGIRLAPSMPVYSLFPKDKPFEHWDARKSRMTLTDLMTMTSGFACDDNNDASPGNEDNMQSQPAQKDWYKYTLDLPMADQPGGKHAVYCSADLNLVGGAVSQATHSWLPQFFDQYLARPLQFHTYHVNLIPTGEAYMGGGLYLRPRDALKLGQLYLSGGMWNGRRVVRQDWVRQSTMAHSMFDPQTDYDAPHEYGFGWHINRLTIGNHVFATYSAGGNGGQIVMVIPELDLVVGFNGGSYGEFNKWYRWGLQLVPQYIIPAAHR
jgi:CubicO group peptidase (beta-lactamase class C family)